MSWRLTFLRGVAGKEGGALAKLKELARLEHGPSITHIPHITHHPATMGINACTLIYLGTAHNYGRKLSTSK